MNVEGISGGKVLPQTQSLSGLCSLMAGTPGTMDTAPAQGAVRGAALDLSSQRLPGH